MDKQKKQTIKEEKPETYGTRKCLVCKSTFEADKPWRITCSEECANVRRKDMNRKSDARRRVRRKAYLLELLADLNHADNELSWLNFQYENLLHTAPMNSDMADGKFESGIYYQLRNAEGENENLKAEIGKLKEEVDRATGLKDELAKEQERNAEILEETAKLKVEIARMVKENGETVRELQEKLAYAEKQIEELQAPAKKPIEPIEPETKYPIPKDGGYDLRCQECGEIFWSRDKDNKYCCVDCFLKAKKRKAAEEAEAKGYPAKKGKKIK